MICRFRYQTVIKKESSDHQSDDLHKTATVLARLPTHNTDKTIATQNFCISFPVNLLAFYFIPLGAVAGRFESIQRVAVN
jgi:hypothetical protein